MKIRPRQVWSIHLTLGCLIKRLAEESEQKRKAEEEVQKIKNLYQMELKALQEQNLKLAENTRLIEQRYNQVAELAKKTLKQPSQDADKIAINDALNANLSSRQKNETASFSGLVQQQIETTSARDIKNVNKQSTNRQTIEDSASDKTLP